MFAPQYRDEAIWRGIMLGWVCAMRGAIYEVGFWAAAVAAVWLFSEETREYAFVVAMAAAVRLFTASWSDQRKGKFWDEQVAKEEDERYP